MPNTPMWKIRIDYANYVGLRRKRDGDIMTFERFVEIYADIGRRTVVRGKSHKKKWGGIKK